MRGVLLLEAVGPEGGSDGGVGAQGGEGGGGAGVGVGLRGGDDGGEGGSGEEEVAGVVADFLVGCRVVFLFTIVRVCKVGRR